MRPGVFAVFKTVVGLSAEVGSIPAPSANTLIIIIVSVFSVAFSQLGVDLSL